MEVAVEVDGDVADHARLMLECQENVVVGAFLGAAGRDFCEGDGGRPKEPESEIKDVRAEIEQDTTAVFRRGTGFPALAISGASAPCPPQTWSRYPAFRRRAVFSR